MATKILVADDEPYMIRILRHHLEGAGYEIIAAHNGREAVELAVSESPKLVVLDVMMPEMDGLAALKALKQDEATRAIPVIILTANARLVTRQEAESSGAAAFFNKPFSPTKLLMEIRRLVGDTPAA